MSDSVPVRPSTPAIDAYYAKYHGAQNARYEVQTSTMPPVDNGLLTLRGDAKNPALGFDASSVPQSEIDAAQKYLDDMDAYAKLHGGFYPVADQVDHSAPSVPDPVEPHETPLTGTPVTIPDHLADSFPEGTQVVQTDSGQLAASVPSTDNSGGEGMWHHVVAEIGEDITRLARRVEAIVKHIL